MIYRCGKLDDLFWEHVQTGADLPDDILLHISTCGKCSRSLSEIRAIACGLEDASRVSHSPDCRSAVMSNIDARRGHPAWAYALACILLVVVLATGLFYSKRQSTPQIVAEKTPKVVKKQVEQTKPEVPRVNADPVPEIPNKKVVVLPKSTPRRHVERRPEPRPIEKPIEQPTEEPPVAPNEPVIEDRSVSIVSVTWSSDESPDTSYSYAETDENTDSITICRVEKKEGVTKIYMETSPGSDKPEEGV